MPDNPSDFLADDDDRDPIASTLSTGAELAQLTGDFADELEPDPRRRQSRVSPTELVTRSRWRCLGGSAPDCYDTAREYELGEVIDPSPSLALVFYRKACALTTTPAYCDEAERVAYWLGCTSAFDCGDKQLTYNP